jgi:hypothetical protein
MTPIVILVAAGVAALWSAECSIVKALMIDQSAPRREARRGANMWAMASVVLLIVAGVVR